MNSQKATLEEINFKPEAISKHPKIVFKVMMSIIDFLVKKIVSSVNSSKEIRKFPLPIGTSKSKPLASASLTKPHKPSTTSKN